MASTGKLSKTAAAKSVGKASGSAAVAPRKPKVALALQGSFGHIFYAAGVLDAFRAHNRKVREAPDRDHSKAIEVEVASGCVEMMTPLWLYLADQHGSRSLRDTVLNGDPDLPFWAQSRIAPPLVRPDAWSSFFTGLINAQGRLAAASLNLLAHTARQNGMNAGPREAFQSRAGSTAHAAELSAAWQDICMYSSGVPGQIAFNPLFVAEKHAELKKICDKPDGPTIFTNATRAEDLGEIYLYSGTAPDAAQMQSMGKNGKRAVLRLTPEYFFASGARPPYIVPVPVQLEQGGMEHWMEGAMRCNPPLNPLIDMGATDIVLLRFLSKDAREEPNNNGELNERFIDVLFNIPLQKEIESIAFNNKVARCVRHIPLATRVAQNLPSRREVRVLDPADRDNDAHHRAYADFLQDELGPLSHFDGQMPVRRAQMFDRGLQIGRQLIRHLHALLP